MPKYTINGKSFRSDTPLSDDELEELSGPGPAAEAPAPEAPQEHNLLQKAAELSSLPKRGIRGAAVTGERLLSGDSLNDSLQKGTAAIDPKYEAPKGEKLASFAADMADPRFYPIAGLKVLKGAGAVAKYGNAAIQGLAAGASSDAVNQAEQKGSVNGKEVAMHGAAGAALGPAITAAVSLPGALLRGAKNVAPKAGEVLGNLKEYLGKAVSDNPELMALEGTPDSVSSKVKTIQDTLINARKSAGEKMQGEKEALGIAETLKNRAKNRLKNGKPTVEGVMTRAEKMLGQDVPEPVNGTESFAGDETVNGMKLLPAPKQPAVVEGPESVNTEVDLPMGGKYQFKAAGEGPQFTATEGKLSSPAPTTETISRPNGPLSSDIPEMPKKQPGQSREDHIKELYKLRNDIDTKLKFKPGEMKEAQGEDARFLEDYRRRINERLDSMPEAAHLRAKDAEFSNTAKTYDELQGKFQDTEKGKATLLDQLRYAGKQGSRAKIKATALEPTLQKVNDLAGSDVVGPAKDEMAKALINESEANPSGDVSIRMLLKALGGNPQNAAKAIAAVSRLSNAVNPTLDAAATRVNKAVPQTLSSLLAGRDKKKASR